MIRSILALAASLAAFLTAAHAHDHWDNGEPVPAWVKTVCCGPNEVHHLRPEQVRRNAIGDYVVDIYPFPIPARVALPERYPNALNRRDSRGRMACADIQDRHFRA